MYSENCKTLMKKTEDTNQNIFHAHVLEGLIFLKYLNHPKQPTDSMKSLSNYEYSFFF